jgi:hypothetical protein
MTLRPKLWTACVAFIFTSALLAQAETSSTSAQRTKEDALSWLTSFARYQVLFHADDVKKLRDRVEAMTPEEAAKWWEQTAPQRKVLASSEWSETEDWLRKFLRVQAKYSDEEIRERQKDAAERAKESALSLQEVLESITQARRKLVGGAQAAEETRKMQVAANNAFRQEEVRQRDAARQRSQAPPTPAPGVTPPARSSRARFNEPLIDSLDVARWAILREIYPRW